MFDKSPLGRDGRMGRTVRLREDDEELVPTIIDFQTAGRRDGVAQQPPVVVQDALVVVAELVHETRRALDVGEEQRDCSMRKVRHVRAASGYPPTGYRLG
jgi:hypothetical protein